MIWVSSQLSPEEYSHHAYTCVPEEVDIDVSPFWDEVMVH